MGGYGTSIAGVASHAFLFRLGTEGQISGKKMVDALTDRNKRSSTLSYPKSNTCE
jgi:hypothetical protein